MFGNRLKRKKVGDILEAVSIASMRLSPPPSCSSLSHWNVGIKLKQQLPAALRPLSTYKTLRFIIGIFTLIAVTNEIPSPKRFAAKFWHQNFLHIKYPLYFLPPPTSLRPDTIWDIFGIQRGRTERICSGSEEQTRARSST